MVHFQQLLAFALCAVCSAHALTYSELRERERERENKAYRLDRREGLERERLIERERLGLARSIERERLERERLARDRIVERERLERERLALARNIERERLERERLARERINERERLERLALEERNAQRERLERERLGEREGLYGPIGLGLQRERSYGYGHGYGVNEGYGYGLGLGRGPSYSLVPWVEPTRGVLSNGHSGNIELQNKIVRETYSPTYYQPEYIVDYRFLRSGGRAFTQGPGGQIIILPRSVKEVEPSGHNSYDRLIENLLIEEEQRGRLPYQRVQVDAERERLAYGRERDGLGENRGEYGYGRVPREQPKDETKATASKVEAAKEA